MIMSNAISAAPSNQVTVELADFLCAREERIIAEWMTLVRRDKRLRASDTITTEQLRDHLPMMFNDLADTLRSDVEPENDEAADANAVSHGHHRWEQGYRLDELLRELARVRLVLLDHILDFEEQEPEFRGEVKRTACRRFHFFFDQMVTRSAEQFVREQQAELRARNEHLRAVDDSRLRLLRASTHDIRNAANAAQLSVGELPYEKDPEVRAELLDLVARNLSHMNELVRDLLTFSTLFDAANSPRIVPLQLDELFDELVASFRPRAEAKGLTFNASRDQELDHVVSDPTKLRQIAHNLLSNAVKYTEHGEIDLCVRAVDAETWSIIVQDTGPGIPAEEREHLFREYHRAADTAHVEGTGLGLWIVKRLVDLLEGKIRLESELGRGSRFEVRLPRAPQRRSIHPSS